MEQELVGAALAVVGEHVRRVVQEVADGEADEAVAGHREAPLQVRHHVRGLQRVSIGNGLQIAPQAPDRLNPKVSAQTCGIIQKLYETRHIETMTFGKSVMGHFSKIEPKISK